MAEHDVLGQAEALLSANRLDEAEPLVRQLRTAPHPGLQTIFLSGMLHLARGRYMEAAAEFRLMLAQDPTLLRPRLELARALYLAHDYQAARYHFEQVLAVPLPDAVRQNVLAFIGDIRNRVPSLSLSLDIASDSNPRQATSSKTIEIAGQSFVLSDEARAEEEVGLLAAVQAKFPVPSNPDIYASGYVEMYDYPQRDLDQLYLQVMGGKYFPGQRHEFNVEAGVHYGSYQGRTLYSGPAARIAYGVRLRPNVFFTASLDAREFSYDDYTYLTGWQYSQSVELRYAISPHRSIRPGVFFVQRDAEEDPYAYDAVGISVRYVQEWRGGWIGSLFGQYASYRYRAADLLAGIRRDEDEWRVELTLANRLLTFKGFAPRLTLGAAERDSSIDLYAYDRRYVRVGFTREF
ncbi:MAG: DUF560 domain-containing protein [Burkholderiales bacterium]|nr:DUF560 domain-containing protein [Burkholderiales bacterium]